MLEDWWLFSPRCIICKRGILIAKVSVRHRRELWQKRTKVLSRFLYHIEWLVASKTAIFTWYLHVANELSNEPKMNILRCLKPRKGGSKTQNDRFSHKSRLFSDKVCYKVSLCSCKAFTGRARMVAGRRPLKCKFCSSAEPPLVWQRSASTPWGNMSHVLQWL